MHLLDGTTSSPIARTAGAFALALALLACDGGAPRAGPLPEAVRLSPEDVPSLFADATEALGLGGVDGLLYCLAAEDLDGDGLVDLTFWRNGAPLIFRGAAGGGFVPVAVTVEGDAVPDPDARILTCVAADLDGDGRGDIVAGGRAANIEVL